ncbi:hypothetical protein RJ640_019498 [Escallonia rubra]|uniref:Protein PHLOEM PROTEIN 2-LIKE A1-like n=1 Tax=Escallonia rubra TaxID=112253 RepID=A0AA88S478_9ASTE|nr:hypothetical protein RJ640_019498 [Escallonia rubra]
MGGKSSRHRTSRPQAPARPSPQPQVPAPPTPQPQAPREPSQAPREPRQTEPSSENGNTNLKEPHNCEAILNDADILIDKSSIEELQDQLYAGVFLNQKRKKYWVERISHHNCFMLFARDLAITWADNERYWHWPGFKERSDAFVDVAEMLMVCWLEVHGRFDTTKLSPGIVYEVFFVVMLKEPVYGWEVPVNLRLIVPDGSTQEHKENLMEKERGQWIEILAGKFMAAPDNVGDIQFSLYEYEGGIWKKGLLVKGVAIRPKA